MASIGRVISEMLNESHQGRSGSSRMQGGMIAKVVDNVDPEDRYRVRVSFPWLSDQYTKGTTSDGSDSKVQSHWARITTMMAGKDTGSFWLPEIDDEVMVDFEEGDFSRPIIMGSLWNGPANSPRSLKFSPENQEVEVSNHAQGGANDYRFIRSRAGSTLAFIDKQGSEGVSLRSPKNAEFFIDDTSGGERICMYDSKQNQWLSIETDKKKITLETDTGDILIKAKEKIRLECKNLEVEASENIKVKAGQKITQECTNYKSKSSSSTEMDGGGKMVCKAGRIDLNP